jgi:hypothetical protein
MLTFTVLSCHGGAVSGVHVLAAVAGLHLGSMYTGSVARRHCSLQVPAEPVDLSTWPISVHIPFHMSSVWFMAEAHSGAG